MTTAEQEITLLREALGKLNPKASAAAADPLPVEEIYTPGTHSLALSKDRTLIVGNRGTGKSVWSGALADKKTRDLISESYPDLGLKNFEVVLGFHEGAGKVEGVAPSGKVLTSLIRKGYDPESIWTAVLLRATFQFVGRKNFVQLGEAVEWVENNPEDIDEELREINRYFKSNGKVFILVFDALDRISSDWSEIRALSTGILRLALGMESFTNMRAKIFMRTDQFKDDAIFSFPDASKLKSAKVDLAWHSTELYGLLYNYLLKNTSTDELFRRWVIEASSEKANILWEISRPEVQKAIFDKLAGEFMGTDRRRGRTYTWLIDHLADAFQETTPRSFLVALQRAAVSRQPPVRLVIDHHGIREGVQAASDVRINQLQEDYYWISSTLKDLEGLEVPCDPGNFIGRWRERSTVKNIADATMEHPGPVELESNSTDKETLLLDALQNIGVVERRSEDRINMPDIFRVAAKIKRRGGVKPPMSKRNG
ncbi:hypothetical protein HU720_21630 [Pseudomonas sp. SWRI51]|uniref:hypothetical protein n=1 Tax=Pseudomonas sp. SWRI51 TaxID=2745491 RepID=UPI001646F8BC|nr:hypothetical protein [Pseudomonas sp. SWRI51]MBC3413901.1 hypothetical protein [Pseudomonas sp. SWRI51]